MSVFVYKACGHRNRTLEEFKIDVDDDEKKNFFWRLMNQWTMTKQKWIKKNRREKYLYLQKYFGTQKLCIKMYDWYNIEMM